MGSLRIFYCPRHGRITANTFRGQRTVTVFEPPYHKGCPYCEPWAKGKRPFTAKRGNES